MEKDAPEPRPIQFPEPGRVIAPDQRERKSRRSDLGLLGKLVQRSPAHPFPKATACPFSGLIPVDLFAVSHAVETNFAGDDIVADAVRPNFQSPLADPLALKLLDLRVGALRVGFQNLEGFQNFVVGTGGGSRSRSWRKAGEKMRTKGAAIGQPALRFANRSFRYCWRVMPLPARISLAPSRRLR